MDNLIKVGGGVTPIYIPSLTQSQRWGSQNQECSITFQLEGKYKKLTIASQGLSYSTAYGSYFYIDCDGTRKYSASQSSGTNLEIDVTNIQQCVFTYCHGHNGDYSTTGTVKDILFV